MELVVRHILHDSTSYGSPGIDQVRWPEAVRPDDQLTLRVEVLESSTSASGGTGILRWRWSLWNQSERQVLDLVGTSLFDLKSGIR
jgi:acyl dehydratase